MVATAARLHQLPACGEASRSSFTVPPRLGKASAMEPKASFTLDGFFHFQLLDMSRTASAYSARQSENAYSARQSLAESDGASARMKKLPKPPSRGFPGRSTPRRMEHSTKGANGTLPK